MVHELPVTFEIIALAAMVVLLVADLLIVGRRPHVPSMKESAIWVGFYVALALIFGGIVWGVGGVTPAAEFYAGWLMEYSLSVDNLFVFVIIMARFAVPREQQQRVLMVGIIMALIFRAAFILAGAALIEQFTWLFYLFGAFLIYTAIHQALPQSEEDKDDYKENVLIRQMRKVLPLHHQYDGGRLTTMVDRRRLFTPLIIVFLAIGSTDVLFAVDSIPAIFGITRDPFIVFATNLFALMGLRQLYFLLGGLLDRLVYLPYALSVVLGFIGIKLILEALHTNSLSWINGGEGFEWAPEVPIWLSLTVIVVSLAVGTIASLVKSAHDARKEAAFEPAAEQATEPAEENASDSAK
ncbi:TerC family protein [Promicromonospora thailandica]|uniref:Tellurite resistance protein TerC n=1 Tax=Promicromonospora thailandica TaxID=765201 RepID=A0A9X2JY30_9MICO|nr:TerC family protein [Promicromonospora thailandica]MCP2266793.1 tellurite resistance protein TerC [Promicromonospora thailandica]BFF21961.1 TerC family protein [Promicromonospora thailandica]